MRPSLPGAIAIMVLAVAVARADTLATLDASQVAAQRLNACFDRHFQPGQAPVDSPAAQHRLLAACDSDWQSAAQACHAATGDTVPACRKKTAKLADDYLGIKAGGIQ